MRKIICLALIVCTLTSINAQRPASGNFKKILLTGIVIDEETKEPLEYTSIALRNERRPDRVQGGITDANGKFEVAVFPGKYNIAIEYIGFTPKVLEDVLLRENKDLGTIALSISAAALGEVEVVGERTEVEIRLDKRIYNVGKDITVRGGTVADVLDNVPSVSVDVEGNVALRGNDNVRILINGKPSGLVGISGPQGLRQIPAESIEKVEVVTSPSARYDAEGTAGILNIILKKEQLAGINGTFIANAGLPTTYGGSATLNWRNEKWNIFTTNTYNNGITKGNSFADNEYFNDSEPSTFLEEKRLFDRNRESFFTNLGVEYFFDDTSSLNVSGFYRVSKNANDVENVITQRNNTNQIGSITDRIQQEDEDDVSFQYSANFFKDFDDKGHKLTAVIQYEKSYEDELADIKSDTYSSTRISLLDTNYETNTTLEDQKRWLAQADYVYPIDENTQFELGYRGTFLTQETDYDVSYLEEGVYNSDANLSNILLYKEFVNAAYVQYGKKINKFSYLLGLRMEDSNITIDQKTTQNRTIKKYTDWFPTVNLSYELNEKESFTLGYSRRLRRPRSRFINPFPSRSSIVNIFQGNPDLDPTYSNAYDLGYLKRWDKLTLNTSVYYQKATKAFVFIREENGDTVVISGDPNDPENPAVEVPVVRTNPVNLAENIQWGTEFTVSYFPSRKLRFNGNFNLFSTEVIGDYNDVSFDASNLSWFARFNSSIKLPGDVDWQLRMFYRGPRETAQSKSQGIFSMSGALNKEIFKNKGTIAFRVSDIFNSRRRVSETFTDTFYSYSEFQWRQPTYILSLTYRLNQKRNDRNRRGRNNQYGGEGDGEGFDF